MQSFDAWQFYLRLLLPMLHQCIPNESNDEEKEKKEKGPRLSAAGSSHCALPFSFLSSSNPLLDTSLLQSLQRKIVCAFIINQTILWWRFFLYPNQVLSF